MAKVGAPSSYSDEIAAHITMELVNGRSLRSICLQDEGMPNVATVIRWLANPEHDEFRAQYARAREAQADIVADEILDIADETQVDARYNGEDVTLDISSNAVARNRLRVDARKWYAGKLAPKKYGDKLAVGGDDSMDPIRHTADVTLTPAEAYRKLIG